MSQKNNRHKQFKITKSQQRCIYTGKKTTGHQVIIARYAFEYVSKSDLQKLIKLIRDAGYYVSDFKVK